MKKMLLLSVMVLGFVGSAWAADGKTEAVAAKFKTGKYETCLGTEEECRQHKGFVGGDELYFEKNGTGRSVFKFEESPFLWNLEGNMLNITPDDGDPYQIEVKDDSALLADKKEEIFYRLLEDEDTVFAPGLYFQCPQNTVESCLKSQDDFFKFYGEDGKMPYVYMVFYDNDDDESQFCPKESKDCVALKWQRPDDGHVTATLANSSKSKLNFRIDRNMLVDDGTGAVYLRVLSERVMKSVN